MHGSIEVYWFIKESLESCREEILRNFFFFPNQCTWSCFLLSRYQLYLFKSRDHDFIVFNGPRHQFLIISHPPPCCHTQHMALWNLFTLKRHSSSCLCAFLGTNRGHTVLHTMDTVPSAVREHWLPATISRCYCALSMMVMKATLPQRRQ